MRACIGDIGEIANEFDPPSGVSQSLQMGDEAPSGVVLVAEFIEPAEELPALDMPDLEMRYRDVRDLDERAQAYDDIVDEAPAVEMRGDEPTLESVTLDDPSTDDIDVDDLLNAANANDGSAERDERDAGLVGEEPASGIIAVVPQSNPDLDEAEALSDADFEVMEQLIAAEPVFDLVTEAAPEPVFDLVPEAEADLAPPSGATDLAAADLPLPEPSAAPSGVLPTAIPLSRRNPERGLGEDDHADRPRAAVARISITRMAAVQLPPPSGARPVQVVLQVAPALLGTCAEAFVTLTLNDGKVVHEGACDPDGRLALTVLVPLADQEIRALLDTGSKYRNARIKLAETGVTEYQFR